MAHLLIAGCGYLGQEIARRWLSDGGRVTALTSSFESAQTLTALLASSSAFEALVTDISSSEAVSSLAQRVTLVDVVMHTAASGRGGGADRYEAVYRRGVQHLSQSFPQSRLVFTSSSSVYPQIDGSIVTENSSAEPPRENGKLLRAAEDIALQAGGVVARLAGIYGPHRSVLLKQFIEDQAQIDIRSEPPATPDGRWINQIHRDDAAAALIHLAKLPTQGEIYNVADSTPLTQREVYQWLATKFHRPLPPEGPPDPSRKRGWSHKQVSAEKLRATGWQPLYPSWFSALENDQRLIPSVLA